RIFLCSQRYFINDAFYKPGGPVFLNIGGPETACESWISMNNTWVTYAERLGALFLLLEHRFYGHSQPTGDLSTASLRYLSSRQALADIVNFRTKIAKKMGLTENKWVAFGCWYGGFLAAWSRIKYPELFAAAVGSSAPMQAKANFYEYLEVVQRSLATHNSECFQTVKEAFKQVVKMMKLPEFYNCVALYRTGQVPAKDLSKLIAEIYVPSIVLISHPHILERSSYSPLCYKELCVMVITTGKGQGSNTTDYLNARSRTQKDSIGDLGERSCSQRMTEDVGMMRHRGIKMSRASYRQQFYQFCTEFGFFQTTDSKNQPFTGLPLSYFVQQCSDFFDPKFNYDSLKKGVKSTNAYYSGFKVTGSKIIFPNGSFDPWHVLGIPKDITKDLPAVFIKGAGHCADLYKQKDIDSTELIQARERIFQILQKWLK
uniref:Serine protease 16 n=1 Tax=Loxodonta africana TaxID=9785 RepID=G3UJM7_LOXAF